MSDPLGLLSSGQPTIVKVHGTAREDVNGKLGIAAQYNTERGRYIIQLTQNQTTMALKPENIVKANTFETYQGQYQQLINDPRVKSEITKYYNIIQSKLPPGMKPEYVAGGCLLGLVFMIYFVGFTRFITLFSMVLLLVLIVGPDVASGKTPEQIVRNFPRNCQTTIENSFPIMRGRINDKIAVGIVVIMLLLSGKTLLASYSSPTRSVAAPVSSQGGGYSTPYSGGTRAAIEDAYKKGFDDATNGSVFGHSLPPPPAAADTASSSFAEDEIPYDYSAVPATKPASKFGIGQMMSLFYMYRMAMQLGNDPAGVSGFSLERAIANAQIMPVWQMGILGFTLFNLVKPFFF